MLCRAVPRLRGAKVGGGLELPHTPWAAQKVMVTAPENLQSQDGSLSIEEPRILEISC